MSDRKFDSQKYKKLESPKRKKALPVDEIMQGLDEIYPEMVIADIGCGIGYLTIPLAEKLVPKEGEVLAVDIDEDMLSVLEERKEAENIEIIKSQENRIPVSDQRVDASFLVTVFHELHTPTEFIEEIDRISKPEHEVVIVDWTAGDREMGPGSEVAKSEKEVIELFSDKSYRYKNKFMDNENFYGLTFIKKN